MTQDGDKPPEDDAEEASVVDTVIDETAVFLKRMASIFRREVAHPARRAFDHGAQKIDTLLAGVAGDDEPPKPKRARKK